jgi:putative endonuclease
MGARAFYVYILASRIGGTLYIGVTNDLVRRTYQHKSGPAESFAKEYEVNRLVYFECFDDIEAAFRRDAGVENCVDDSNWIDLYSEVARGRRQGCRFNREVSGILGRPISRAMTAGGLA